MHGIGLLLLCCLVATPVVVRAGSPLENVFVSGAGADSDTCGSRDDPCRSIPFAVESRVARGGTLVLSGSFTLNRTVSVSMPMTYAFSKRKTQSHFSPLSPLFSHLAISHDEGMRTSMDYLLPFARNLTSAQDTR